MEFITEPPHFWPQGVYGRAVSGAMIPSRTVTIGWFRKFSIEGSMVTVITIKGKMGRNAVARGRVGMYF